MNLTIKAKAFELEALEFINNKAPEVYRGKKHGFYWAAHEARLSIDTIDWKKIAKIKLEKYFSGDKYEGNVPVITHLTAEEEDYNELAHTMEVQFELKKSVQKAYCIRNILKWAVIQYYNNFYNISEQNSEKTNKKLIEDFSKLSTDEKLTVMYAELIKLNHSFLL